MRLSCCLRPIGVGVAALVSASWLVATPAAALPDSELPRETQINRRLAQLERIERPLRLARAELEPCAQTECLTPSEAVRLAYAAGPDRTTKGRFILDVRAAGPGNAGTFRRDRVFFLNSERHFQVLGVLTLAIEPEAANLLLGEGVDATPDIGLVKSIKRRFVGQRIVVDGEVGLKWIELVDWETGLRNGSGYHQVWVRITSPDQIRVIGPAED